MTRGTKEIKRPSKAERRRIEQRRALRRRLGFGIVGLAAAAALLVFALSSEDTAGKGPSSAGEVRVSGEPRARLLAIGDEVPEFSAPGLDGGTVSWRPGEPTVLSIWASWCPHCQVEMPVLDRISTDFPGVDFVSVVTAIDAQPGPSPEEYMADEGLDFPVAVDDSASTLYRAFGIQGFPTTFFVAADGTVMSATEGESDESTLRQLFAAVQATGA
jgi:thiol-disulfide isomerase/thioredoxin